LGQVARLKWKEEVRGKKDAADIAMREIINFKVDINPSVLPSRDESTDYGVKSNLTPCVDSVHQ
jgi:hypothetical protein